MAEKVGSLLKMRFKCIESVSDDLIWGDIIRRDIIYEMESFSDFTSHREYEEGFAFYGNEMGVALLKKKG